jgi:hypothetical protein
VTDIPNPSLPRVAAGSPRSADLNPSSLEAGRPVLIDWTDGTGRKRPRPAGHPRRFQHAAWTLPSIDCDRPVACRIGELLVDDAVELADLIAQLRRELSSAMRSGEGERLRFEPGPVELELTVGVEKVAGPEVKVRFWVFDAGASAQLSSVVTQRIKLTLDPRLAEAPDRRPLIAGDTLPGER